ncbi:MAG: flagellar biosynthesis anti-sigma factor FlgM [Solirubrobacteraceae bacterium]
MKEQQDQKIASLIEQLRRGEYAVDPEAVAVAILNRLRRR